MDPQAAQEYHAVLLKRLHQKRSKIDRLFWIPLFGVAAYFAFESIEVAILGAVLGWAVCAIMGNLDSVKTEIWHVEYLRHLHEYTDEAESGSRKFNREKALDAASRRWW